MKLESANIANFRSVDDVDLKDFGGFNVLIGKNNAGKSNLLSALHAFFLCVQSGDVVTLDPPIGKEIDFFDKPPHRPIEVNLVFSLTLAERDALIRDIVTDAPQVKNAVDGLGPALHLHATLKISPPPTMFGFIGELSLRAGLKSAASEQDTKHLLLCIADEAASEIRGNFDVARRRVSDATSLGQILRYMDADDWQRYRQEAESGGRISYTRYNYMRAQGRIDAELDERLNSLVRGSPSHAEFEKSLQSLIARTTEEAAATKGQALKNKITTFAGDEVLVPSYIKNLLLKLSELKVLYFKERRTPIGKDDAERLLSLKIRRGGPEVLRNIQETVAALLGVQIDAFSGSEGEQKTAEMDVDNFLVEANGSGIREALRLVLDVEFEHPNILLVEEPEMHLHPALESGMMRYLKRISSDLQVFISTHSTNFLDTADMQNAYLVSKPSATQVQLLNFEEAVAQVPRELGMRLSSFFMFDRLVFVEGPSDEAIIREWASALNINLSAASGFPVGGYYMLWFIA